MKLIYVVLPVLLFAALALAALAKASKGRKPSKLGEITACMPVTENEQAMYFRLVQAFPSGVVLAQVAFSALIQAKDRATRSTFDRKRADFVICTKAFQVAAIIELDDSSHRGREAQDAKRDDLLIKAGYRVLRYRAIPDIEKLRIDVAGTAQTKAA